MYFSDLENVISTWAANINALRWSCLLLLRSKQRLCDCAAMMEPIFSHSYEAAGMHFHKQILSRVGFTFYFLYSTFSVLGASTEAAFQQPRPLPPLLSHITWPTLCRRKWVKGRSAAPLGYRGRKNRQRWQHTLSHTHKPTIITCLETTERRHFGSTCGEICHIRVQPVFLPCVAD